MNQRKFLSLLLIITFFWSNLIYPSKAVANIGDSGLSWLGVNQFANISKGPSADIDPGQYLSKGKADITVHGTLQGKGHHLSYRQKGYVFIQNNSSILKAWIEAFRGNWEWVQPRLSSYINTISANGNSEQRIHIRDLAELSGINYTTGVLWNESTQKADVLATKAPSGFVNIPPQAKAGDSVKITIKGTSHVTSENSSFRNRSSYTLRVNGAWIAGETINSNTFEKSVNYTIPANPSTNFFQAQLTITDGVGRSNYYTRDLVVVKNPVVVPEPVVVAPEPTPPPASAPQYSPNANFMVNNWSPNEGDSG
ncbi:hypothetical protein M1146_06130, partial [Patescibacteria group bacterium]|nr:hypothetical protein [Patescibacteria group bacterium]